MKKKKLKKKLKQLERRIEEEKRREINLSNWTMAKIDELKKITNEIKVDLKAEEYKEKDNRINILWEWLQRSGIDFHDWGKTPVYAEEVVYTEDIQRQINEINNRLGILDRRTRTDYNEMAPKTEEKTCDTCDYHGLSGCGTQCVECPANNKKEDSKNGN